MDSSSPVTSSPSSDQRFWSTLRGRVDALLEDRKPKQTVGYSSSTACGVESECGKRFREDSSLLIRGFDSVASSLSQLTDTLDEATQEVQDLFNPSLTEVLKRESQREDDDKEIEPKAKRHCGSNESNENHEVVVGREDGRSPVDGAKDGELKDNKTSSVDAVKCGTLKKAKNLAISMATKATSFARELKTVKSELCFVQDRCNLLEEENRRLRDGFEKGLRPDEDDLVRLQLEALLAEKSRLAHENAALTRENQCLHQLVEYHQLTSQDLSETYEEVIHGICLDFSSPPRTNAGISDIEAPCTPRPDNLGCSSSSLDDCCDEEQLQ